MQISETVIWTMKRNFTEQRLKEAIFLVNEEFKLIFFYVPSCRHFSPFIANKVEIYDLNYQIPSSNRLLEHR